MREIDNKTVVPDKLIYTDSERELARLKQAEAKQIAKDLSRKKRNKMIAKGTGAVLALGGVVGGAAYMLSDGNSPDSVKDLDATSVNKGDLNVDGNLFPEKANSDYDEMYGIYEVDNDGKVDKAGLIEKLGLVNDKKVSNMAEGWRLTQSRSEIEESGDYDILDDRNSILNEVYLTNITAAINIVNMNNPTAQAARASKVGDVDQALLLQNTNLSEQFNEVFTSGDPETGNSVGLSYRTLETIEGLSPADASLRATVCPFNDGTKASKVDICSQAQILSETQGESEFIENSRFSEVNYPGTDSPVQIMPAPDSTVDNYWSRMISGEMKLGVVWTNANGEIVDQQMYVIDSGFNANGVVPGDPDSDKNTLRINIY